MESPQHLQDRVRLALGEQRDRIGEFARDVALADSVAEDGPAGQAHMPSQTLVIVLSVGENERYSTGGSCPRRAPRYRQDLLGSCRGLSAGSQVLANRVFCAGRGLLRGLVGGCREVQGSKNGVGMSVGLTHGCAGPCAGTRVRSGCTRLAEPGGAMNLFVRALAQAHSQGNKVLDNTQQIDPESSPDLTNPPPI